MSKQACTYILASQRKGSLYVGATADLIKRIHEHKNCSASGFTARYFSYKLVWYEVHESMPSAMEREKALKKWNRLWKLKLVESFNPEWKDLYEEII